MIPAVTRVMAVMMNHLYTERFLFHFEFCFFTVENCEKNTCMLEFNGFTIASFTYALTIYSGVLSSRLCIIKLYSCALTRINV